jgi:hypothetical protein
MPDILQAKPTKAVAAAEPRGVVVEIISIAGAARRLQVCQETIRRYCDSGLIPCARNELGARVIRACDLEWLARKRGL